MDPINGPPLRPIISRFFDHVVFWKMEIPLRLNYVGFFWIGGRVGKRKWIISGVIYLLIEVIMVYAIISDLKPFDNIMIAIFMCSLPAGIIQSFLSRKEYLLRCEAVKDLEHNTRDLYREEIRKDYFGNNQPPKLRLQPGQTNQPILQNPISKIDLNSCSEQQLANLPGVGIALAKRAIGIRAQNGPFVSSLDFCNKLGLQPHFAVQIEQMALAALPDAPTSEPPDIKPPTPPDSDQPPPSRGSGRIIDI